MRLGSPCADTRDCDDEEGEALAVFGPVLVDDGGDKHDAGVVVSATAAVVVVVVVDAEQLGPATVVESSFDGATMSPSDLHGCEWCSRAGTAPEVAMM